MPDAAAGLERPVRLLRRARDGPAPTPHASGWKCPVKWGKPTREDARNVELTNLAIKKLKQIAGVDFKSFLAIHAHELPVGAAQVTLMQTMAKAEAGADAAAAESATRKRKSPAVASSDGDCSSMMTTLPQQRSFIVSTPAPPRGSGLDDTGAAASIGDNSGLTPPPPPPPSPPQHIMFANEAVQLWDTIAERDQLKEANANASNQTVKLNEELRLARAWIAHYQKQLQSAEAKHAADRADLISRIHGASHHNNKLNEKHAKLKMEYMAERTKLIGHLCAASGEV
ncbi:uncharacterized protein LOC120680577 [Panicum virgatum]|uniref:uncharacterized protein LOC120680577 n=1 Tax=Panicum virgatum TaxID=38727 RepID=UPI0019D63D3D|nr:uncharacterized protein LOC120680577 [Panicum virgatum]